MNYKNYSIVTNQSGTFVFRGDEFIIQTPTEQEAYEWIDENED